MAKKPMPTIAEIAKRNKAAVDHTPPEEKSLWFRELKKSSPHLAAETLAYARDWKFKPNSEAKTDCPTRNALRNAIQLTINAHGFKVKIEKTCFGDFIGRLEQSNEQRS